jgi:anti-sigma factor ChrR (cupin superfamily)
MMKETFAGIDWASEEQFSQEKQTEVAIEIKTDPGEPELILRVTDDAVEQPKLDAAAVIAEARALAPGNEIVKVVADIDAEGNAAIDYAVDEAGTILGQLRPRAHGK